MTSSTNDGEGHVKDLEIAAYLDRGLSADQVDRIEDHLASCTDCRENVTRTQELIANTRRPRRFLKVGVLLAAAAALVVAVPSLRNVRQDRTVPMMRDGGSTAAIVAYGPVGEMHRAPVQFVWGSVRDALSYRLSITRTDGSSIWSNSVTDTTAAMPASVKLDSGSTYLWVVDALLRDGTSRSTGVHEFGMAR